MPAQLTKNDLLRYPHLKERVQEDHPEEKKSSPSYYRSMMEYREKYHTLRAGVVGSAIGGVLMTIMILVV